MIKTILAPTDFSASADNAADYAAALALRHHARLVLFNVFYINVFPGEIPVALSEEESLKESAAELEKIKNRIILKYGNGLEVTYQSRSGLPVDEINAFADECKADLIVMGMESKDSLTEKMIGSITTSLIKKASCPVLSVDGRSGYKEMKNIVLAYDHSSQNYKKLLEPLKELISGLNVHLYVLSVLQGEKTLSIDKAVEGIKLEHALEGIDHSFHFADNKDVISGIRDFVNEKQADIVVMIPRSLPFLERLFHKSDTKRMAFHSSVPLLALHENNYSK